MNQLFSYELRHFHLLPETKLHNIPVSPQSLWTDPQWRLENPTPGLSGMRSMVKWNIDLPDGSCLLDAQWSGLLDSLRRFVWSLLVDPREGKNFKATSMAVMSQAIASLVRWMVANHFQRIGELDNDASWEYVEYVTEASTQDEGDFPTVSAVWEKLHLITMLYKQSAALTEAGIEAMPEPPFDGRSPFDVAKEVAVQVNHRVPPLPDAVALPTMAAAERLIGIPADNVISLQDIYLTAYRQGGPGNHIGPGKSPPCRSDAARMAVAPFHFSTLPGESLPWRAPIDTRPRRGREDDFVSEIRGLIMDVRNACIIVLQSHVGQRISEVMGLKAGVNQETGLPSCIVLRTSRTGLNTLFYLKGLVSKIHSREMEWVIGARPANSAYIPPPVRALVVLEQLYQPWRELGERDDLIVSFTAGRGLPKSKASIGRPYSK